MTIRRIAMLSVHTCPLATLGGKETGGMNVYVRELTRELSQRGLAVDVFTRSQDPAIIRIRVNGPLGPNGRVIHLPAGPERPYNKNLVRDHLPEFVAGVKAFADREGIRYDVLHSHYWLSGLAARELRAAWGAPIVQMFHTLGELKNQVAQSAAEMEGGQRISDEAEIMRFADRLVAATALERDQMQTLYGADPAKVAIVPPGVNLTQFRRLPSAVAKANIGIPPEHRLILFVGRVQPIKGIDTLIRAMALVLDREPELRPNTCLIIIGGDPNGGSEQGEMARLTALRETLGLGDLVTFLGSKDQDPGGDGLRHPGHRVRCGRAFGQHRAWVQWLPGSRGRCGGPGRQAHATVEIRRAARATGLAGQSLGRALRLEHDRGRDTGSL